MIIQPKKLEKEHKLLRYFSGYILDHRHPLLITHSIEKLLKQRVFMLMQGYQDANDVFHLQHDPLIRLSSFVGTNFSEQKSL